MAMNEAAASSPPHEPVLEVQDLSVSFGRGGREVSVLHDVSFILHARRTLGIVGESGSGKSVTALTILRLIRRPPLHSMSGRILYGSHDLASMPERELRPLRGKDIAFVFQEPMTALNPVLTIGEQIMEMIRAHKRVRKKEARERAVALLAEVGMPSPDVRLGSYPHELSGGMRQRAMIAMALSCDPKILIADEPTTALDVTVQAQILDLLRRLREDRRMSVLFITHDLGVIAEVADDVLVMEKGTVVEYAPAETLFRAPVHPYTRRLLSFLPSRNRRHGTH